MQLVTLQRKEKTYPDTEDHSYLILNKKNLNLFIISLDRALC